MASRVATDESKYMAAEIMRSIKHFVPRVLHEECEDKIALTLVDLLSKKKSRDYGEDLRRAEVMCSGVLPSPRNKVNQELFYSRKSNSEDSEDDEQCYLGDSLPNPIFTKKELDADLDLYHVAAKEQLDAELDDYFQSTRGKTLSPSESSEDNLEQKATNNKSKGLKRVKRRLFADDSEPTILPVNNLSGELLFSTTSDRKVWSDTPSVVDKNNEKEKQLADQAVVSIRRKLYADSPAPSPKNKPKTQDSHLRYHNLFYFGGNLSPRQASPSSRSVSSTQVTTSTQAKPNFNEDIVFLQTQKLLQETMVHVEEEKLYHSSTSSSSTISSSSTTNSFVSNLGEQDRAISPLVMTESVPILGVPESRMRYPSLYFGFNALRLDETE